MDTSVNAADLLGPGTRLLFVGINPGLRAAAVGAPFAGRRGNRFYPALASAGVIPEIDASTRLSAADRAMLINRGIGITSLVTRPTAGADELTGRELRDGVAELTARVERIAPAVVAFLGISAFRTAFSTPRAAYGPQPQALGGCPLWVVPNPSGRNLHHSLADITEAFAAVARAAGITPLDGRPERSANAT